jgi:hypothetical protein
MTEHKPFAGGRTVWRKTVRLGLLAIAGLSLFALAVACGGEKGGGPTAAPTVMPTVMLTPFETPVATDCVPQAPLEGQANLFHNPGFESGRAPWCSLHLGEVAPFKVSQDFAHSGESSAYLQMRVPAEEQGNAKVFYLVQEVTPEQFPELISGYYRVEHWTKGTPKQYLQFVVIAFDVTNLAGGYPNYQMRYPLAGISEEPFEIANAFFVFLTKEEPRTGEWVYFERNIKEDFQQSWGAAPEGFSKLRVLFEVRYDDKAAGATPAEADVYYDDLYMGPASENPNKP